MENDKICPICGGLMLFSIKKNKTCIMKAYLCLHCGHIDVIEINTNVSISSKSLMSFLLNDIFTQNLYIL